MATHTKVTELRTGRRPQNAILCRGIARPDLFYTNPTEHHYSIPEHVPVFTTRKAMENFMGPTAGSKRGRDDGDANLIPVVAHMGVKAGDNIDKPDEAKDEFIFVGISYGEASKARPTVRLLRPHHRRAATHTASGFNRDWRADASGPKPTRRQATCGWKASVVAREGICIRSRHTRHSDRGSLQWRL